MVKQKRRLLHPTAKQAGASAGVVPSILCNNRYKQRCSHCSRCKSPIKAGGEGRGGRCSLAALWGRFGSVFSRACPFANTRDCIPCEYQRDWSKYCQACTHISVRDNIFLWNTFPINPQTDRTCLLWHTAPDWLTAARQKQINQPQYIRLAGKFKPSLNWKNKQTFTFILLPNFVFLSIWSSFYWIWGTAAENLLKTAKLDFSLCLM